MRPLSALGHEEASALRGVLFDLDDTLLSHGSLTEAAYSALWDLKRAGLLLVAVTGRPAGWGEVIARQWPIDAAVTENGAVVISLKNRRSADKTPATMRSAVAVACASRASWSASVRQSPRCALRMTSARGRATSRST